MKRRGRPDGIGPLVCCGMCGTDTRSPSGFCKRCRGPETAALHEHGPRRPTDPQAAEAFDANFGPPDTADPYHGDLDDTDPRLDDAPTCRKCGEDLDPWDGCSVCPFCEEDGS